MVMRILSLFGVTAPGIYIISATLFARKYYWPHLQRSTDSADTRTGCGFPLYDALTLNRMRSNRAPLDQTPGTGIVGSSCRAPCVLLPASAVS